MKRENWLRSQMEWHANKLFGVFFTGRELIVNAKRRKCEICRTQFPRTNTLHTVCSMECAVIKADRDMKKRQRAEDRARRDNLKTLSNHIADTQKIVNQYVRLRDVGLGCISCGIRTGKMNAGHYRSTAAAPELRFHLDNIHKQCEQCNTSKSSNAVEYRIALVKKIGVEKVEWLEGPHEPKRYRVEELKAMQFEFKQRIKEIKSCLT